MSFIFTHPKIRIRKARAGNAQEILKKLSDYLNGNCDEPAEILCGFWRDQANVFSYQEIRMAVMDGYINENTWRQWAEDYSRLVNGKLRFMWENAMIAGSTSQPITNALESFVLNMGRPTVLAWIKDKGGKFVTNCIDEQRKAIAYLTEKTVLEQHSVDELARLIRPCVGLTLPQTKATMRYYDNVAETLRKDNPRMREATVQKRAKEAAVKYAEKQHRQRAMMIAQTEMAYAYNKGADEGIRQAQEQGLIGKTIKRWCTSGDANVCRMCADLNGREIGMDDKWQFGPGWNSYDNLTPPAHPRCGCAVEYIEVEKPVASTAQGMPGAANSGNSVPLGNSLEGYTDSQKREMNQLLSNAPQEVRDAFAKYGSQFQEVDSYVDPTIGRAYFDRTDRRVHMNRQDAAAGSNYEARYQMHFHEYAHNLDYLAGNGNNFSLTWRSQNGEMLEDIIEKDWDNSLKSFFLSDAQHGYKQNLEVQLSVSGMRGEQYLRDVLYAWRKINRLSRFDSSYLALKNELNSLSGTKRSYRQYWENHFDTFKDVVYTNYAGKKDVLDLFIADIDSTLSEIEKFDISDMFQRYAIKTGGPNYAKSLGYGHEVGYALDWGNLTIEAFAEMTAARIASPDSLAQIKKYLPNAYNAYLEILRGMI